MSKDNIDSWFFKNLIKMLIDSLITLLRLIRPPSEPWINPNKPDNPKPRPPMFPWLRKKVDNIFHEENNE